MWEKERDRDRERERETERERERERDGERERESIHLHYLCYFDTYAISFLVPCHQVIFIFYQSEIIYIKMYCSVLCLACQVYGLLSEILKKVFCPLTTYFQYVL